MKVIIVFLLSAFLLLMFILSVIFLVVSMFLALFGFAINMPLVSVSVLLITLFFLAGVRKK